MGVFKEKSETFHLQHVVYFNYDYTASGRIQWKSTKSQQFSYSTAIVSFFSPPFFLNTESSVRLILESFLQWKTTKHLCVEKGIRVFFPGRRLLAAGTKYPDFTSPNFRYTTLPAAFACRFSRRFIIAKNTGITTHVAAIHAVWSVKHTAVYPNLGITNMDIKPLANSSLKPAHIAIAL